MLATTDFGEIADAVRDLHPNQLIGLITVQTALLKAVFCAFLTKTDTAADQTQAHINGISH